MYRGDKKIDAQALEPMMADSLRQGSKYLLVHLVRNWGYNFLCGLDRYKTWQHTRRKVTCQACLTVFQREKEIEEEAEEQNNA